MTRPQKLDSTAVDQWLSKHAQWARAAGGGIAKKFDFADFSEALAFVVRVGCYAEKRDHHPDVELGYGKARVTWSTHDAGGVTELDLAAAEATDKIGE